MIRSFIKKIKNKINTSNYKYCAICKIFVITGRLNTRCSKCNYIFIDIIAKVYNIDINKICLNNFSNECNICLERVRTVINYPCLCITNCSNCIWGECVICHIIIEKNIYVL